MLGKLSLQVAVLGAASASLAAQPGRLEELIQPTVADSGWILHSQLGEARVEDATGAEQRLAVRSDELLTTLAETHGGWTAAGLRELDSRTELVILRDGAEGRERLPAPGLQRHSLRLAPVLITHHGELMGLAWLEGPDPGSLSVRAAAWRQSGAWEASVIVSPTRRGSQTGLTATALADGSWLLVWSAFDGHDDELLWSRGGSDNWSSPRRVAEDNRAPDILPAVLARKGGALLAWSRMVDGQYQLMTSEFSGHGWSRPQAAAPPGSLDARFTLLGDRLHLVYRHAWPRGWAVLELAPDGRARRWAAFAEPGASRPIVSATGEDRVELRWPGAPPRSSPWEMRP